MIIILVGLGAQLWVKQIPRFFSVMFKVMPVYFTVSTYFIAVVKQNATRSHSFRAILLLFNSALFILKYEQFVIIFIFMLFGIHTIDIAIFDHWLVVNFA